MNIKMVEEFLLWCGAINFGMLLIWFLFFMSVPTIVPTR